MGALRDLVQFVVGYGETGSALVTSGVDKVIFVGSPAVGVMVARTAAANLTPVVLELVGKSLGAIEQHRRRKHRKTA